MKKIICTSGCFNILHPGHIQFLQTARKLGDELHIFLDSDKRNEDRKNGKVIFEFGERLIMLSALECVTKVHYYDGPTDVFQDKLNLLRGMPAQIIFVKAGDYTFDTLCQDQIGVVKNVEGITVLIDYDQTYSTTKIFQKIRNGVRIV